MTSRKQTSKPTMQMPVPDAPAPELQFATREGSHPMAGAAELKVNTPSARDSHNGRAHAPYPIYVRRHTSPDRLTAEVVKYMQELDARRLGSNLGEEREPLMIFKCPA